MHDGTDTLVKYIFAGGQRIARVDSTTIHYYHKDHLGSPTVITDAFGIATEAQEYLPFGDFRDHWSASGEKGSDYYLLLPVPDFRFNYYTTIPFLPNPPTSTQESPGRSIGYPHPPQIRT